MPQMAPMKWLCMFIIFSITFIMFNTMNYFLFTPSISKMKKFNKLAYNSLNWKW